MAAVTPTTSPQASLRTTAAYLAGQLLALLVVTATARAAGPFELVGVDARAKAMGGAQTAVASGYTAAFYNPALLARTPALEYGLSLNLTLPNTFVTLAQPLPDDSPYQPQLPHPEGGLAFGVDLPVGGKLGDRLAVGFSCYLPAMELSRIKIADPAVPHWYLYESGLARMEVVPGVAVRPFDWLALGAGARFSGGFVGPTHYVIDPVAGSESLREFNTALRYQVAPVAGIALGPFYGFRAGLVYRGAIAMPIDFPNNIDVAGLDIKAHAAIGAVESYSPHTAVVGLAYSFLDGRVTLAGDLQYLRWQDAPDPSVRFAMDVSGSDLERLGLGDALDVPQPGMERSVRPAFQDTLVPRLGVEAMPLDWLRLRAGYYYWPTPVPDQTSGANYVDNNSHGATAGIGFAFRDPFAFFEQALRLDVSAELLWLMERRAVKQAGNDPVGDWRAGGQLYDVAVSFSYTY